MPLKLNGDNSVSTPAFTGDDDDTGLQCGTNGLKLVTGGTEAVTVDSSQNVGIGTTNPSTALHVSGTGVSDSRATFTRSSVSGIVGVVSNDLLLAGDGTDGTDGGIQLWAGGSRRANILLGGGISFGSDTAQANALDDYEEGTWVPNLTSTSPGTGSYTAGSNNGGFYTKIGKRVFFQYNLQGTWTVGTASGSLEIDGLPFPCAASADRPGNSTYSPVIVPYMNGLDFASGYTLTGGLVHPGTSAMRFYTQTNTSVATVAIGTASTTINIHGGGSYEVA